LNNYHYNFKKGNYPTINYTLNIIDWNLLYKHNNTETACNTFNKIIFDAIKNFVPKKLTTQPKFPHCFSHELKQLLFKKKK
jgi:hypothetical protein